MNSSQRVLLSACLILTVLSSFSQEVDLFKMQDSAIARQASDSGETVINTFYSSRLVNSHTVELTGVGSMDFRINHRFAPVSLGLYQMFGLDVATMRMGFDFGLWKNFAIGVGRTNAFKEMDGYLKWRLVHQKNNGAPLSVVLLGSISYRTIDMDPSLKVTGSDRTYYSAQLLLGSKLNRNTSVQLSPTYTRYNRIMGFTGGNNNMFSLGFLARQKLSRRISLTAEYFWQLTSFDNTYDPLSIGVDINTGGHVFQLHFTNSLGMNEHSFIHETRDSWADGDIRWGFNLSRIFSIGRKAVREKKQMEW
jgi:hypothetical protein